MENTVSENVVKAKQAIEAIMNEYNVTLVPIIVHQGSETFSSVDVVSVGPKIDASTEATPAA